MAPSQVLFSDTVGFIQKLPTKLVNSFRATLDELEDAALILHVVDSSSPLAAQVHPCPPSREGRENGRGGEGGKEGEIKGGDTRGKDGMGGRRGGGGE